MSFPRRFSQAISEGAEISFIAEVATADEARAAEADGAEAVLVHGDLARALASIREATTLPILLFLDGESVDAIGDADACILDATEREQGWLKDVHWDLAEEIELVPRVEDEDQLRFVLDELEPEIVLLAVPESRDDTLEHVLGLLSDVPAGKLAVAEARVQSREEVVELERAGVDAVIVRSADVPALAGAAPPQL
jgi:NAD(P)H-dependent flavin oxidoreductase YrpB (nitropropane dioxygenase family)